MRSVEVCSKAKISKHLTCVICETRTNVRLNFMDDKGKRRVTNLVMHRGVPQGFQLSESLFILTMAEFVRKVESNDGAKPG